MDAFMQVRNEHRVPVNMRIGVHTGYLLSGLIGKKITYPQAKKILNYKYLFMFYKKKTIG
jgi:hypothetical protein